MNYNAIDLGLPSGTKWCDRNIGASSPEDAGLYFAWGEYVGLSVDEIKYGYYSKKYNWKGYKFSKCGNFTKYNKTDGKTVLDLEDDAAHANMGGDWVMPTKENFDELVSNTTNVWVEDYNGTGIFGRIFISKVNGNSIFVPTTGYAINNSVNGVGVESNLWSSTLNEDDTSNAWNLYFNSDYIGMYNYGRGCGFPMRGVIKSINNKKNKNHSN